MTDMIERAARALFKHAHAEHVEEYQWEEACLDLQQDYLENARAALLAALSLSHDEIEAVSREITGCMGSLNGRGTATRTVAALVTVLQKATQESGT